MILIMLYLINDLEETEYILTKFLNDIKLSAVRTLRAELPLEGLRLEERANRNLTEFN